MYTYSTSQKCINVIYHHGRPLTLAIHACICISINCIEAGHVLFEKTSLYACAISLCHGTYAISWGGVGRRDDDACVHSPRVRPIVTLSVSFPGRQNNWNIYKERPPSALTGGWVSVIKRWRWEGGAPSSSKRQILKHGYMYNHRSFVDRLEFDIICVVTSFKTRKKERMMYYMKMDACKKTFRRCSSTCQH